jgi:hypothetical protein
VLYEARSQRRDPKALPKRAQWEERYSAVRDYFLEAVQFELGLVGKISREVPPSRELKSTQKLT